jgi:hypothetical protein
MKEMGVAKAPMKATVRRRVLGWMVLLVAYAFFFLTPSAPIPWTELRSPYANVLWWFSVATGVLVLGMFLFTPPGRQSLVDRYPGSLVKQVLVALFGSLLILGWSYLAGHQTISAANVLLGRVQMERGAIAQVTWPSGKKCSPSIEVRWTGRTEPARHCMSDAAGLELKVGQAMTRRTYAGPFGEAKSRWIEPESGYGTRAYRGELKHSYVLMFWIGLGLPLGIALTAAVLSRRWGWAAVAFAPFIAFGLL